VQATLQQTRSAQKPDWQSAGRVQADPSGRKGLQAAPAQQTPASQRPVAHSMSQVQSPPTMVSPSGGLVGHSPSVGPPGPASLPGSTTGVATRLDRHPMAKSRATRPTTLDAPAGPDTPARHTGRISPSSDASCRPPVQSVGELDAAKRTAIGRRSPPFLE
jgi:hypothetical protein